MPILNSQLNEFLVNFCAQSLNIYITIVVFMVLILVVVITINDDNHKRELRYLAMKKLREPFDKNYYKNKTE